jgi:isopentenyl diphosphate isomerase/L-lactate dehydrogenase-like FMN-dependent dehydrogenase
MRVTKNQLRKIIREVLDEQENIGVTVDVEQEDLLGDPNKMRAALLTMYPEKQVDIFMANMSKKPEPLQEALTKTDKADIKAMVKKEVDSLLSKELKKAMEDELIKALKKKNVKDDIADITKKIMKKLYRDLSLQHPYIIDRIKL